MYKLVDTNGYAWNYLIYTGAQGWMAGIRHAETVLINLLDGFSRCYRAVVVDSLFAGISVAKHLLAHHTYVIGTLRSKCVASGKEFFRKIFKHSEACRLQNKDGIKLIMWKDKKDVLMISTRPTHSEADLSDSWSKVHSEMEFYRTEKKLSLCGTLTTHFFLSEADVLSQWD